MADHYTNSIMTCVESWLDRKLEAHERVVIKHLSPQGVAKLNRDMLKGTSAEHSLNELKLAFKTMLMHRNYVESHCDRKARKLAALMGRASSLAESVFLLRTAGALPTAEMALWTQLQKNQVNEFATTVEDLTFRQVDDTQMTTIQVVLDTLKLPVAFVYLAPTEWVPPKQTAQLCSNHTVWIKPTKIEVRFNPITTWFHFDCLTPLKSSTPAELLEDILAQSNTASPVDNGIKMIHKGALKSQPGAGPSRLPTASFGHSKIHPKKGLQPSSPKKVVSFSPTEVMETTSIVDSSSITVSSPTSSEKSTTKPPGVKSQFGKLSNVFSTFRRAIGFFPSASSTT